MSDLKQITDALDRLLNQEGERIVFWNDSEGEFLDFMDRLPILTLGKTTVKIVRLDRVSALETKIRLERQDPTGRYLLYSPTGEPDDESDWLLDIRLYSRSFRADRASILLDELGLADPHLRRHLADRRKFFDSKERLQKLKALASAGDAAADLDRKMIAVAARAEPPELFSIVLTLFHAFATSDDELDLDSPPPAWGQVESLDVAGPFWQMVQATFGYADEDPTLKKLLIRLLVTDYVHYLKAEPPPALQHLALAPPGRANAVVCLAQWRDSHSRGSSYDRLSARVAALIKLDDHLAGLEIGPLLDVMTFQAVEQAIASRLRERVQSTVEAVDAEEVRAIATRRQAGHWASLAGGEAPESPRPALHAVYDALVAAADFFALRNRHRQGFDYPDAPAMYRAYEKELFRFDQLYRHFCEAADQAALQGWSVLKPLREVVEACYTNWYEPGLALGWGRFVDPQGRAALLDHWQIEGITNQQRFYDRQVRPRLQEADQRKAFVVISDAFRYEAAQELVQELNGRYRLEAALSSQLGVLPSFTALGMASLLPHRTLSFKPGGEVQVDGKPTASLEQRNEVLKSVGGMACKFDELLAMKKDAGRELVKDKRVVYVYHNAIDAVGDSASTEAKTFEGVRRAIDELARLVAYIINSLNGNHIVITADHGFLFTEAAPGEPEKSKLEQKPGGTVRARKRYLIGRGLPDHEAVWHGRTAITAGAQGEMELWIPRAANRFHFAGGSRFVHGGAMLQEIVVPVVTVRHKKAKATRGETRVKSATVHVLGSSHKITTHRHRFELIQMEPVGERVRPVTLKVAVYEGEEPVTHVETVIFDSASDQMDERKKWVPLVLQDRPYHKKTLYRLVLRDAETGIEHQSVPVVIDRAFTDDF